MAFPSELYCNSYRVPTLNVYPLHHSLSCLMPFEARLKYAMLRTVKILRGGLILGSAVGMFWLSCAASNSFVWKCTVCVKFKLSPERQSVRFSLLLLPSRYGWQNDIVDNLCWIFRDAAHVLTLSALDPTSDWSTHQRFGPKCFLGLGVTLALIMIGKKA